MPRNLLPSAMHLEERLATLWGRRRLWADGVVPIAVHICPKKALLGGQHVRRAQVVLHVCTHFDVTK